jgi:transcriptional regulator with XRE-family HTH domain
MALKMTDAVHQARLSMRISQKEVAQRAAMSLSTYQRFEKNGDITLKKFVEVLRMLGRASCLHFDMIGAPQTLEQARRLPQSARTIANTKLKAKTGTVR